MLFLFLKHKNMLNLMKNTIHIFFYIGLLTTPSLSLQIETLTMLSNMRLSQYLQMLNFYSFNATLGFEINQL
jgi:hypothetical protein